MSNTILNLKYNTVMAPKSNLTQSWCSYSFVLVLTWEGTIRTVGCSELFNEPEKVWLKLLVKIDLHLTMIFAICQCLFIELNIALGLQLQWFAQEAGKNKDRIIRPTLKYSKFL